MLKIRRPLGRLIFNMGIAIPGKTVFLIETAPCQGSTIHGIDLVIPKYSGFSRIRVKEGYKWRKWNRDVKLNNENAKKTRQQLDGLMQNT